MTKDEFTALCSDLSDETFPKNRCKERGELLVFIARLTIALMDEAVIDK